MNSSDTEDDERPERGSSSSSNQNLRNRLFKMVSFSVSPRVRDKPICTTPGQLCAGETETETDEPVRAKAFNISRNSPLIPFLIVTTSSNISNHSRFRPSRTPEPPTTAVNTTSLRILSSSLNSPCLIWHALQLIPRVSTSNL